MSTAEDVDLLSEPDTKFDILKIFGISLLIKGLLTGMITVKSLD